MVSDAGARLGREAARRLALTGRRDIGPGLTEAEFARIERDYGLEFADDHRAFLAVGLPRSQPSEHPQAGLEPWPDWRDGDPVDLRRRLGWPVEGVLFDVEHNAYWDPSWGRQPPGLPQALSVAQHHLARVPMMIPVYSHRYLPAGRGTHGHPVLSIHQTDIIVYGADLAEYITNEFTDRGHFIGPDRATPPLVPFWSEFL
jgi:hypothetical protein